MRPFRNFLIVIPFFTILFIIMGMCTLRIGGYPLLPAFFLIPVYYWIVFRPEWVPLWSLFIIGIFYDSLMGHELGLSSLLLIFSSYLGQYIRPYLIPHYFSFIWGMFGLYSFLYLILFSFFVSSNVPILVSWFYGLLFYPLVVWGLSHLHLRLQSYV